MKNTKSLISCSTKTLFKLSFFLLFLIYISGCSLPNLDITPDPTLEVVVAEDDQMVDFGVEITLSGFASHSAGISTNVMWEIVSKPSSSTLTLSNPNASAITFTPDELGEYLFRFTAESNDGLISSDEVMITVIKAPVRLSGTLTSDRILENIYDDPNDPDYIVSGTYLLSAELTIEEDVLIIFEENAGIQVQTDGSLIAIGSESKPIVMTGVQKTKGFWKGLNFLSRDRDNELSFVSLEYGGSGGFDGANRKSNVTTNQAIVKISSCTISNSAGIGLLTRSEEDELPDFNNNVLKDNEIPAEISKIQFHYLNASNDFSGNEKDYINGWGQSSLTKNVTWNALNVPYRLRANFERIESDLTIEKGAEFIGQPGSGIQILNEGSIVAVGTASEPIIFRGEEDVRGYWMGMGIFSNTNRNELAYVTIKNGGEKGFDGGNVKSNLIIEGNARLKMNNCRLEKSADFGLVIRAVEGMISSFIKNTITDNKIPIECKIHHFHYFDNESDMTGNDEDAILTSWANSAPTVNATWKKTTVPYKIIKADIIDSEITIEPGVEIIMKDDAGMDVWENGTLIAVGTAEEPIIFRGEQDVQGFWKGISIKSNDPANRLEYVHISNGGSSGYDGANRKSNIDLNHDARVQLRYSIISQSGGYGVTVLRDALFTESDNTFENNKSGDIFYQE